MKKPAYWLCVETELAIWQCRLKIYGTQCPNNSWYYLQKKSCWVENPSRPPYLIPHGSAGVRRGKSNVDCFLYTPRYRKSNKISLLLGCS